MNYRRLGKAGLKVSELSFGSWVTFGNQVGDTTAEDCLKLAYDNGINFFDNAEGYAKGKSEEVMGNILAKMKWPRSTLVISSKVFFGSEQDLPNQIGLSRKHIFEACHASLRRLQVDYLDLFFCHRPDPETPIEETVRIMNTLIEQGKVLYWGTSEWSAEQIEEAYKIAEKYGLNPPTMEQPQYNLFHRERVEKEYAPLYKKYGLGTTIWSPLDSGLLTGKYNKGIPKGSRLETETWLQDRVLNPDNIKKVPKLMEIADDLGINVATLAIAWCLKNPNVSTVILGASKLSQLEENLKADQAVSLLTDEVMRQIDKTVS